MPQLENQKQLDGNLVDINLSFHEKCLLLTYLGHMGLHHIHHGSLPFFSKKTLYEMLEYHTPRKRHEPGHWIKDWPELYDKIFGREA